MRKLYIAFIALAAFLSISLAASAAPTECSADNMAALAVLSDKAVFDKGESASVYAASCYEPPGFVLWAKIREAPTVLIPLSFDGSLRLWKLHIEVTQEIQPGTYHIEFIAKTEQGGKEVYAYPPEKSFTATIRPPDKQSKNLDGWYQEKEKIIKAATVKIDDQYKNVPKFPVVGVWFDAEMFRKYHATNSESYGPWNPFLRKTYGDELKYLSKTLGMNLIVLSGGNADESAAARKLFPYFVSGSPEKGGYAIFDEPDYKNTPMDDVIKWSKDMHGKGMKTIVNFSGHSPADTWTNYVFDFLDKYAPDVVSVDSYPVFHDYSDLDFFRARIVAVGKAAHEKKAKYFVILQGFSQSGKWAFPTLWHWQKMLETCREAKADGVIFFLWTSGASDKNEIFTGIDAMPQEYHRMMRATVAPKPPRKAIQKPPAEKNNEKPEIESKPGGKKPAKAAPDKKTKSVQDAGKSKGR